MITAVLALWIGLGIGGILGFLAFKASHPVSPE